jgi:trehalose-phosphatase
MSGRALPDVQKRVGIPGLIYAGNHGLEIEGRGLTFRHPGALAVTKELTALGRQVARAVRGLPGVRVEDKGLSWTLHVRRATAWTRRQALRVFWDVVGVAARRGRVRVRRGSMIREVLPPVTWDKGAAVRWILAHLRPGTRPLVIYVGDDLGDESAFAAVGRKGLSVVFGRRRRTRARFFLKSREELQRLLQSLTLLGHGPAPCSRLIRRR